MSIVTLHENSFSVSGTGDEKSYDPQKNLENFYYSLSPEHRLHMPYEYRDIFETVSPPDYNDQFVFFMLAFFDAEVKKTEMQKIDLGFSALLALLEINHASWINTHTVWLIKEEIRGIFQEKSHSEVVGIFENLIPDKKKQIALMTSLRVISVLPHRIA